MFSLYLCLYLLRPNSFSRSLVLFLYLSSLTCVNISLIRFSDIIYSNLVSFSTFAFVSHTSTYKRSKINTKVYPKVHRCLLENRVPDCNMGFVIVTMAHTRIATICMQIIRFLKKNFFLNFHGNCRAQLVNSTGQRPCIDACVCMVFFAFQFQITFITNIPTMDSVCGKCTRQICILPHRQLIWMCRLENGHSNTVKHSLYIINRTAYRRIDHGFKPEI